MLQDMNRAVVLFNVLHIIHYRHDRQPFSPLRSLDLFLLGFASIQFDRVVFLCFWSISCNRFILAFGYASIFSSLFLILRLLFNFSHRSLVIKLFVLSINKINSRHILSALFLSLFSRSIFCVRSFTKETT